MGEFDDFTRKLGEDHAKKSQEHQTKERQEREERHARYEVMKGVLVRDVVPLLEEANIACQTQGLRTEIADNWRDGLWTTPSLDFQVFGPKKRPDESTYEVSGHRISISHDGEDFQARVSRSAGWNVEENKSYQGRGIEGVKEAIKVAIQSLYAAISPDNR